MTTFDQYQIQAMQTARYPRYSRGISWLYPALALGEEAGEVQGKLAKMVRKNSGLTEEVRQGLKKELGDVLWNLAALSHELGFRLSEVAHCNLEKLAGRNERGTVVGEGDER
jgi:NTP pyrophosphatase (non-canonical NTP hydrolase)